MVLCAEFVSTHVSTFTGGYVASATNSNASAILARFADYMKKSAVQSDIAYMEPRGAFTRLYSVDGPIVDYIAANACREVTLRCKTKADVIGRYVKSDAFKVDVVASISAAIDHRGGEDHLSEAHANMHANAAVFNKFNVPVTYSDERAEPDADDLKKMINEAVRFYGILSVDHVCDDSFLFVN